MKWAIPRAYVGLNSTNGFTIGRSYKIVSDNGRVATVINDNGHERVIPMDGGSNAHLQKRTEGRSGTSEHCAGHFDIFEEQDA